MKHAWKSIETFRFSSSLFFFLFTYIRSIQSYNIKYMTSMKASAPESIFQLWWYNQQWFLFRMNCRNLIIAINSRIEFFLHVASIGMQSKRSPSTGQSLTVLLLLYLPFFLCWYADEWHMIFLECRRPRAGLLACICVCVWGKEQKPKHAF